MSKISRRIKQGLMGVLTLGLVGASLAGCGSRDNVFNANLGEVKTLGLAVVPNQNRIDVIELNVNRVTDSLETDSLPTSIAVSPDGRMILVTSTNSGTVSVYLRRDNNTFERLNSVGNGVRPIGVAFNPVFNEAYVAYEGDSKLLVLDTTNRNSSPRITRAISLADSSPRKIVVSKDGSRIFMTDGLNDRIITLVKTGTNFTRNFSQPFDQNRSNVDLEGMIIVDDPTIPANQSPPANRIYVANGARSDIFVFDGNQGTVVGNIPLQDNQFVGQNQVGPKNMVLYKNPTTGQLKVYVAGFNASVVSVIDPQQGRLLRNVPLYQNSQGRDSYNPVGIAVGVSPSNDDAIYVTNAAGLAISMIDPSTDTLLRNLGTTISAGSQDPLGEFITVGPVT